MTEPAKTDVFVVGGGINGCGIARDLAGRGYAVSLAERQDFASGTSSWSTKLIHGGLRYLEHYEFRLVREALIEREVLWQLAPHIIPPVALRPAAQQGVETGLVGAPRPLPLRQHRGSEETPAHPDTRPRHRSRGHAPQGRFPQGVRILRLLCGRCPPRRPQRTGCGGPGRGHPPPHRGDFSEGGRRPLADRPQKRRRNRLGDAGTHARERCRAVGGSRARARIRPQRFAQCPAGAGKSPRGPEALRPRSGLHLSEFRPADHLRHSLRGRLYPRRHHRSRLAGRP